MSASAGSGPCTPACAAGLRGWHPRARPFARGLYDPAHLLLAARVSPDGRPGPLGWRSFWQRALADDCLPLGPRQDLANLEQGVLDAAALLETVYANTASLRRDVAEAFCFGQRVFGEAPSEALPDVLIAVRGYSRYRSLDLTLERLGIRDPAVYAEALDRAERIARIADADRAATALSLYQGALVLVERARLARTLEPAAASRLVTSLVRLPTSVDGEYHGAVAAWVDAEYLPTLGAAAPANGSSAPAAETAVLAAFAGRCHDSLPERVVDFEGMRYRVDPSSGELARLEAVRDKQGGISLDAALALAREARRLGAGVDSVAAIPARLAALNRLAAPVAQHPEAAPEWDRGIALRDTLASAARDLGAIRQAGDLRKVRDVAASLTRAADRLLGHVLASLAYAGGLTDPDSTALVGGDPSLVHDWGLRAVDEAMRVRWAWAIPDESHEAATRWHVHGSLLALDVGLANLALRRLSSDALPSAPTISEEDRQGFTEAAVLSNAWDYRDEEMALLAAAIRRGRGRVASLAADPSQLPGIAEGAGLDEGRRAWLSWAVVHERERVSTFFSLGDLLRLGRLPGERLVTPDAWGASGLAYDGRLSLRFPVSQPFATLAGRRIRGLMASLVPDLALLVAENLDDRHLPAALTRAVLLVATPDYMDRLALAYDDDWLTLVADVQRIVPARMDDYLALVATGGPLVPLTKSTEGKQP